MQIHKDVGYLSRKDRLRHFVHDGVWAAVCDGVAESNFTAYATAISASAFHLNFLASIQSLVGCWFQLWSDKLVPWLGGRKRFVLACVGFQIFTLSIMIAFTLVGLNTLTFLGLSLVFSAVGGLGGSVWSSWISDLLPQRKRGFCFGVRNQRTYPMQFLAVIGGGFILKATENSVPGSHLVQHAFALVFLFGLIAKCLSFKHLYYQPEIRSHLPKRAYGPMELLSEGFRDIQLRRTLIFFAIMSFGVNVPGSYQTPYVLQNLHLGYFPYASITATLVIARFLAAPVAGRMVDQIGYQRPLLLSTLMMPTIPLSWCFARNLVSILGIQVLAGCVWITFELAVFCFLTESAGSEERQRLFSLKQISSGLASAAGSFTGALLIKGHTEWPRGVFWLSSAVRLVAAAYFVAVVLEKSKPEALVTEVLVD